MLLPRHKDLVQAENHVDNTQDHGQREAPILINEDQDEGYDTDE